MTLFPRKTILLSGAALCAGVVSVAVPAAGGDVASGMEFADEARVKIEDPFWSPRFDLWRTVTIADVLDKLDRRSQAIVNFDLAAKGAKAGRKGPYFMDGLLLESVRGASDYLRRNPSEALRAQLSNIVTRVMAAQCDDGYLNTRVQVEHPERRWGDNGGDLLTQHEIYNAGCLIEAGVHYYRATGDSRLVRAGVRFANLMCDTMGPLPKRNLIPTHSLAESALVELVRLLREDGTLAGRIGVDVRPDDYMRLVGFWFANHGNNCGEPDWATLGLRGVHGKMREMSRDRHGPQWRPSLWDYQMDARPLKEYRSIEGHAVRAALLVFGLAAYGREVGDAGSLALARRFWGSMVGRKMYISGGVGSRADMERFGEDYELPPDAYLETCAAVASAFTSAELAAATGDGMFMDEFERVVYNAMLTAVGADGRTYTYKNPLNTDKGERWDWHKCPCCPPMFLKLTGALPKYVYSRFADGGVGVNMFISGETAFRAADGGEFRVVQRTRYPDDGTVRIEIAGDAPGEIPLRVRVPGWARGVENPFGLYRSDRTATWSISLNGKAVAAPLERGYATLRRTWRRGDVVTLVLDVGDRTIRARDEVTAVRGMVAHMRGPVLMVMENGRQIPYWDVANNGAAAHSVWNVEGGAGGDGH